MLGFHVVRGEPPTVTAEVQAADGTQQVIRAFESALAPPRDREPLPYELSWADPQTLVVDLPEPPPALFVDLR